MSKFLGVFLLLLFPSEGFGQSLSGIEVGDSIKSLVQLGMPRIKTDQMGKFTVSEWELSDRNTLSIRYDRDTGQIVFIELSWGGSQAGRFTNLRGFVFGETTLAKIRREFGSNGFQYAYQIAVELGDAVATLNCWEILDPKRLVVVFATKVETSELDRPDFYPSAKLDSIILSDPAYLSELWGPKKIYSDGYKGIHWRKAARATNP